MVNLNANYLTACDLIYRSRRSNIHCLPQISKLSLRLVFSNFVEFARMYSIGTTSEKDAQVSLFFFLFVTFFITPYLSIKKSSFRSEIKTYKSFLQIAFNGKNCDTILRTHFLDFYSRIQDFLLWKSSFEFDHEPNFFVKLDLAQLSEVNFYARELLKLADVSDLSFYAHIKLKNIAK